MVLLHPRRVVLIAGLSLAGVASSSAQTAPTQLDRIEPDSLGAARRIGEFRDESDLALRISEVTQSIHHIPDVLHHARIGRSEGHDAERRAIADALERRGEGGRVEEIPGAPGFHSVRYPVKPGRIDIIIPSRDQGPVVDRSASWPSERPIRAW
jgi:hypothetical protein